MPELFPERHDVDHSNDPREVCRCGHVSGMHRIPKLKDPDRTKQCYECLCPDYVYEQTLTMQEALDLSFELRKKYRQGFKQ
jgi:hypothetical protein